jgi:hypothetical protein
VFDWTLLNYGQGSVGRKSQAEETKEIHRPELRANFATAAPARVESPVRRPANPPEDPQPSKKPEEKSKSKCELF